MVQKSSERLLQKNQKVLSHIHMGSQTTTRARPEKEILQSSNLWPTLGLICKTHIPITGL